MNQLGKIQPMKALSPNLSESQKQELQNNPLVRLMMSDDTMKTRLATTKDPKLAEQLMQDKLKAIGLSDAEIVLVMLQAQKTPLDEAMKLTGLSKEEVDGIYDNGAIKINKVLGTSTSLLENIGGVFNKGKIYSV